MSEIFDRYETRPMKTREAAFFREFKAIISIARSNAHALREQTRGVDLAKIKRFEDLAVIPVLRDPHRARLRAGEPLYNGCLASRPGFMHHLFLNAAAGATRDWWNAARAMHAADFCKGEIILNCASFHFSNGGHMIDGAARELGCASIPAGPDNVMKQIEAIGAASPVGYCGKPGGLRRILDSATAAKRDVSSLKKAFVFGAPLSTHFRREAATRNIRIRQAYTTPEAGVIAYETSAPDGALVGGMVVNENVIVEIVKPGGAEPAAPGEIGEIVITRLNVDFPLLRFGTGDLSRIIPGPSPCGRTNMRIEGWMGHADETTRFNDRIVLPSQVIDIGERHPCVQRVCLVLGNQTPGGEPVLKVEGPQNDPQLPFNLRATMKSVLGFEGRIDIVCPGTLPDDGRLIADERVLA